MAKNKRDITALRSDKKGIVIYLIGWPDLDHFSSTLYDTRKEAAASARQTDGIVLRARIRIG